MPDSNFLAQAQSAGNTGTFTYDRLVGILNYLVTNALILGEMVAWGAIVYYGVRMAMSKNDATQYGNARKALIKACIGAALIFGVYVVIATVQNAAQTLTN